MKHKQIQSARSSRPLWAILLLSSILPGSAHWLLGQRRQGTYLLLGALITSTVASVALGWGQGMLWWLFGRASMVVYVFAIVDSAFLDVELGDGRATARIARNRWLAFWNLLLYGMGYWKLGRPVLAVTAGLGGLILHTLVAGRHGFFFILVELILVALASHAWLLGRGRQQRSGRPALGEIVPEAPRNSMPRWLKPALAGGTAFLVLMTSLTGIVLQEFQEILRIRQDREVIMEPYYSNPAYHLSLEMNAPGWTFQSRADEDFVVARHVSEDVSFRLSLKPRIPGMKSENFAYGEYLAALQQGSVLKERRSFERPLGPLPGYLLEVEGLLDGQPRRIIIATAGKGFRQYVMWMDWEPAHDAFARQEIDALLASMELEGKRRSPIAQVAGEVAR